MRPVVMARAAVIPPKIRNAPRPATTLPQSKPQRTLGASLFFFLGGAADFDLEAPAAGEPVRPFAVEVAAAGSAAGFLGASAMAIESAQKSSVALDASGAATAGAAAFTT